MGSEMCIRDRAWYGPLQRALERMREFGGSPGQHRYGPVEGLPELRALMADKLERENGISLSDRSVLVTAGANMGFLNALFTIADAGDEIILPIFAGFPAGVRRAHDFPVFSVQGLRIRQLAHRLPADPAGAGR